MVRWMICPSIPQKLISAGEDLIISDFHCASALEKFLFEED